MRWKLSARRRWRMYLRTCTVPWSTLHCVSAITLEHGKLHVKLLVLDPKERYEEDASFCEDD